MATIAIVWELGADLGHHPILILRDLSQRSIFLKDSDIPCIQAPTLKGNFTASVAVNFTETLLRVGYQDKEALALILGQWLDIYARTNRPYFV